jgi:ParB family chromosome partitioning protein
MTTTLISTGQLRPSGENARRTFDEGELTSLAVSIATLGVIEPIVVRPDPEVPSGKDYLIVAGERRYQALCMIEKGIVKVPSDSPLEMVDGLVLFPVVVRSTDDHAQAMMAENVARVDLSPIEEAAGYKALLDAGVAQRDIAISVGRSQSVVSRRLGLLALSPELRAAIDDGHVDLATADKLTRLDPEVAHALFRAGSLSSWQIDNAINAKKMADQLAKLTAAAVEAGYTIGEFEGTGYGAPCLTPAPEGKVWGVAQLEQPVSDTSDRTYTADAEFDSIDELVQFYLPTDEVMLWPHHDRLRVFTTVSIEEGEKIDPKDSTATVGPKGEATKPADDYKAKEKERQAITTAEKRHLMAANNVRVKKPPSAAVLTMAAFGYLLGRMDQNTLSRAAQMLELDPPTTTKEVMRGGKFVRAEVPDWPVAITTAWDEAKTPARQREIVFAAMLANLELMAWSAREYQAVIDEASPVEPFDKTGFTKEYRAKQKAAAAKKAKA